MIKQLLLCCIFFTSLSYLAQGQTAYEQKLVVEFEQRAREHARPIEYLQTDKDIYETGEQLWFRFTQLDGQLLTPHPKDSILYLRLVKQTDRDVFWEEKYPLIGGFSDGMVLVKDDLAPGIYQLEAYSPSGVYHGMERYHAFKELEIRKYISPEIIIRHNHEDDGDSLSLILSDKQANRLSDAEVKASWLDVQKKPVHQASFRSDAEGKLSIPIQRNDAQLLDLEIVSGNKQVFQRLPLKNQNESNRLTWHAESGKLVHHQETSVMLSSTGSASKDQSRQGVLLKDGEILTFINLGADGLGKLRIRPEKGAVYEIRWNDAPSDTVTVFDQIEEEGVTINLRPMVDTLMVGIQTSWPRQKHLVRIQMRGIVYVFQELMLESNSQIKIPIAHIPSGIAEVAVFNEASEPLGQRLTWIENNGKLHVEASLHRSAYGSREKVGVTFTVKDSQGQALGGVLLGGAVSDKLFHNQGYKRNLYTVAHILTQVGPQPNLESLMTAPETNDNRKLQTILEACAVEQYIWLEEQMKDNQPKPPLLPNKLRGQIIYKSSKKQDNPNYALLFRGDDEASTEFIPLNGAGNFEIDTETLDFGRDEYLYVRALPKENTEIELSISDPLAPLEQMMDRAEMMYSSMDYGKQEEEKLDYPAFDRNMILLGEFVVRGKRLVQEREKFIGDLAERAKLDFNNDYLCRPVLMLSEILNCGDPRCKEENNKPIEGKEYTEIINMEKAKHPSHHFVLTAGNWRRIKYRYPVYTDEELMKMYNMTRTKGFFMGSGFVHKKYLDIASKNDPESDYRNTLTWMPYILTDEEGKAEMEFYTSDIRSIFTGNFEALSPDGKMGQVIFEFVVE
ncbi:hypothetical protein [Mongoliitalea daihaiensis]|uniref:hypothetical protein n=1 Tax=Mongoliitalea daihaiensis TaxID=2782006 RepID=UPI001F26E092|nr:hypothetical protein [Mongoliitalea daihaiensis]UJP65393.1 hypothetical protein IPZ59_01840 [Mongoliitalea daihaiensis]